MPSLHTIQCVYFQSSQLLNVDIPSLIPLIIIGLAINWGLLNVPVHCTIRHCNVMY